VLILVDDSASMLRQDAYSERCAAQVHGAARDALAFAHRTVEIEANASTDNPMVFVEQGEIVSGGNFHGAPVAIAADLTAIAVAQFATISERRSAAGQPRAQRPAAFLTEHGGLESGLMLAQVTAAAVTSELKSLAHPHPSTRSHVGEQGGPREHEHGRRAEGRRRVALATHVVAVELLTAARAIDLLAPLTTSTPLARVHAAVRAVAPRRAATIRRRATSKRLPNESRRRLRSRERHFRQLIFSSCDG
jgi:histidine ammonia-lyase